MWTSLVAMRTETSSVVSLIISNNVIKFLFYFCTNVVPPKISLKDLFYMCTTLL